MGAAVVACSPGLILTAQLIVIIAVVTGAGFVVAAVRDWRIAARHYAQAQQCLDDAHERLCALRYAAEGKPRSEETIQ